MLQCCLLKRHTRNRWFAKTAPNTPIGTIELMNAQSILYLSRKIFIFNDLLFFSMEMLHLHVKSLKSYLFHIFWIEKYIVHYCFVSFMLSTPEERNHQEVYNRIDSMQLIQKCIIPMGPGIIFPEAIVIIGWKMFLQKCTCTKVQMSLFDNGGSDGRIPQKQAI